MAEVWYPAAQRAGRKHPGYGEALRRQWRLRGIEQFPDDSLLTYVFVSPLYERPTGTWSIYREGRASVEELTGDFTRWAQWAQTRSYYLTVRDY
jgi:hypothetical protein